jgi:hypothetical protein
VIQFAGKKSPYLSETQGQPKRNTWGGPVEGLQCRIPVNKGNQRTLLPFDVRNIGGKAFTLRGLPLADFAVRTDARWYHWVGDIDNKGGPRLPPASTYSNSIDLANPNWKIIIGSGNHDVQIAILLHVKGPLWPRCIWNPKRKGKVQCSRRGKSRIMRTSCGNHDESSLHLVFSDTECF